MKAPPAKECDKKSGKTPALFGFAFIVYELLLCFLAFTLLFLLLLKAFPADGTSVPEASFLFPRLH